MSTALAIAEVSIPCDGRCCEGFHIGRETTDEVLLRLANGGVIDGEYIEQMLVPLSAPDEPNTFGCAYWDPVTRLCTSYETRPQMCREYPYGRPCQHCGVTAGPIR